MANNTIIIGSKSSPTFQFMQDDIESIVCHRATDIVGAELTADTLDVRVFYNDTQGTLANLSFGTPVFYMVDEDTVGKFFVKNVKRTAVTKFTIECTSIVGVLDLETHYGGMYYQANLMALVQSIILTDGLSGTNYRDRILCDHVRINKGAKITPTTYTATVKSRVVCKFSIVNWAAGYIFGGAKNGLYLNSSSLYMEVCNNRLYLSGLGLTKGTMIEVDSQPANGKITVKVGSETHTIDISSICNGTDWNNNAQYDSLHYCFGSSSTMDLSYYTYQVYNGSTKILDSEAYVSVSGNKLVYRDKVTGGTVVPQVQRYWTIYSSNNWTLGSAYVKVSPSRATIVNGISYLNGCYDDTVSGWIKPGTKRTALYQVLYALNLCMYSNDEGKVIISRLTNGVSGSISDDKIYNSGSEEKVEKTRNLYLTEHVYSQTSGSQVVFDNTASVSVTNTAVLYSVQPVYGAPTASGLTVSAYNCNAAVVTGLGKLTAVPYEHSQIVHEYQVSSDLDGRDISVPDATLVTVLNVNNVMDRLKAFYNNNIVKVQNSIIYGGEKCGFEYSFKNVFGEAITARLSSFTATISSIVKLACVYYKNYIAPSSGGSGYTHSEVITSNTVWRVPSGVTSFHVVLIGGGNGGSSGLAGQNGYFPVTESQIVIDEYPVGTQGEKALGGAAGQNGNPGKIYEFNVTSPSSTYAITIGAGGAGGSSTESETTRNSGANGGNTTFGNYSSSSGSYRENGYTNTLTGQRYAYSLVDYSSRQKGANGGYLYKSGNNIVYVNGESVTNPFTGATYSGGKKGAAVSKVIDGETYTKYGGCGSGALFNMNGLNGTDPEIENNTSLPGYGANAGSVGYNDHKAYPNSVPSVSIYGSGGYGGFGGAAGGCVGCRKRGSGDYYYETNYVGLKRGLGQRGGAGGSGVNGCVIIYY